MFDKLLSQFDCQIILITLVLALTLAFFTQPLKEGWASDFGNSFYGVSTWNGWPYGPSVLPANRARIGLF